MTAPTPERPFDVGRVSVNAARIRKLVQRADNDSEQREALAEYLVDSALDIADALEELEGLRAEAAALPMEYAAKAGFPRFGAILWAAREAEEGKGER